MINKKYDLTASIVLFHNDAAEVKNVIECFLGSSLNVRMYLVDNSTDESLKVLASDQRVEYIFAGDNLGYGAGHNVAMAKSLSNSPYHIVLNPDIAFEPEILIKAIHYMDRHLDVGLLSPAITFPSGAPQQMCRQLPTPFDLIARRFLPGFIKPLFKKKLNAYIISDLDYTKSHNIPNLPGSFMFLRSSAIQDVGAFDEKFFMYLEDVDLTRRINAKYKTIFYPKINITHSLAQGSYKNPKLLVYHIESALYYFNKWGWYSDKDRKAINNLLAKSQPLDSEGTELIQIEYIKPVPIESFGKVKKEHV